MRITATELAREAAATGFQTEPLEKVILLLELLEATRSHPFLKDRVALKGGTALNLFRFDVPRLSVDIDLNYIGAVDRDGMLAERPKIEQALQAVCGRVGVQPRRVPSDHAGGKWRLSFNRVTGGAGTLEMDVNFMEFRERLNGNGEIAPEVLTDDERLQTTIRVHPGLLWKALNVRQHRGIGTHSSPPQSDPA